MRYIILLHFHRRSLRLKNMPLRSNQIWLNGNQFSVQWTSSRQLRKNVTWCCLELSWHANQSTIRWIGQQKIRNFAEMLNWYNWSSRHLNMIDEHWVIEKIISSCIQIELYCSAGSQQALSMIDIFLFSLGSAEFYRFSADFSTFFCIFQTIINCQR